MKCKKCGSEVNDGDKFCQHCGKLIKKSKSTQDNSTKTNLKIKIVLIAIASLVLLTIGILIVFRPCLRHDWHEATCTEPVTCSKCGRTKGIALGHNNTLTTKKPTCTNDGFRIVKCTRCNKIIEKEIIDKLGHEYTEWEEIKKATCKEDGLKERKCKNCNNVVTERIKKLKHKYSDWSVTIKPQVGVKGEESRTCSVCGHVDKREMPALAAQDDPNAVLNSSNCKELNELLNTAYPSEEILRNFCKKFNGRTITFPCTVMYTEQTNPKSLLIWTNDHGVNDMDYVGPQFAVKDINLNAHPEVNSFNAWKKINISVKILPYVEGANMLTVAYVSGALR